MKECKRSFQTDWHAVFAGLFNDPIIIPTAPDETGPQSLAAGDLGLPAPVASVCLPTSEFSDAFPQQRKLVYAYNASEGQVETTFTVCSSGDIVSWLLACPKQLTDSAGSDAASSGCTCSAMDESRPSCPLIGAELQAYGRQVTTTTIPNYW